MCTAVFLWNVVGIAVHVFLVGIIPLHRQLNTDRALLGSKINHGRVNGRLGTVQMTYKFPNSALSHEFFTLVVTLINELDPNPGIKEGQLPQALGQDVVDKFDMGENLGTGFESNRGTSLVRTSHFCQGCQGISHVVFLLISFLVAMDCQQQVF